MISRWSQPVVRHRLNPAMAALLALIVAFFCVQLRFIHLRADTPEKVSNNIGLYVDEGYKTLAPRNLVIFGENSAHQADQYKGWMKASPLTNWPYYFMFKWLGVEIENARLVTIAYFALFILLFSLAVAGRYRITLLLVGIFALSLQHTLYFFSRVALLEVPIVTLLYGSLFLFIKTNDNRIYRKIKWLAVLIFLSAFGIKISALLYFFVAGCMGLLSFLAGFSYHEKKKVYATIAVGLILVVITAFFYFDFWWHRIGHSPFFIMVRALNNPLLIHADIFLLLIGISCGLQGLICQPELYLGNLYRAALLGLVLLGPIVLSIFPYNPLRYYVPLVPAYILLILEWLYLSTWRESLAQNGNWFSDTLAFLMLFHLIFYVGVLFNEYFIKLLQIMIGDEPGLSDAGMVMFFAPIAAIVTVAIFILRKRIFSKKIFAGLITGFAVMGLVYNVSILSDFVLNPSYKSREIQADIESIVPGAAIVAGDWAPFFLIGTRILALYMNDKFNRKNVASIRPDFFLDSDNRNSRGNAEVIRDIDGASFGAPVLNAVYVFTDVTLYPVLYDKSKGLGEP